MMRKTIILLLTMVAAMAQAQLLPYPVDTVNGTAVYRYPVEKSIGLYRISVNFGVTQEEIIRWNPQLSSRGLRYDETILIPVKQKAVPQAVTQATPVVEQPQPVQAPVKQEEPVKVEVQAITSLPQVVEEPAAPLVEAVPMEVVEKPATQWSVASDSSVLRLALLLPLQASAAKRDATMDRFYDFYAGALLAVNDAQKRGRHLEIFTYDIAKNDNVQRELMRTGKLRGMDAIIGSTYSNQVTAAAEWAMQDSVLTVIPFSSSIPDIDSNPYLLQFNPSSDMEAAVMADYLAQRGDSVNCVLIKAQENEIPKSVRYLRQALLAAQVPCTYTTIHDILKDSASYAFKDSVENIIVFNTENYSNLITIMPHLFPLVVSKHVTLYSRYSWQNEKILTNQIYTSVFAPSVAVDSAYTEAFDTYFHHSLSSSLPRYDLLGYDLTNHVIEMLASEIVSTYQGLQSTIRFERDAAEGGFKNKNIQVIRK